MPMLDPIDTIDPGVAESNWISLELTESPDVLQGSLTFDGITTPSKGAETVILDFGKFFIRNVSHTWMPPTTTYQLHRTHQTSDIVDKVLSDFNSTWDTIYAANKGKGYLEDWDKILRVDDNGRTQEEELKGWRMRDEIIKDMAEIQQSGSNDALTLIRALEPYGLAVKVETNSADLIDLYNPGGAHHTFEQYVVVGRDIDNLDWANTVIGCRYTVAGQDEVELEYPEEGVEVWVAQTQASLPAAQLEIELQKHHKELLATAITVIVPMVADTTYELYDTFELVDDGDDDTPPVPEGKWIILELTHAYDDFMIDLTAIPLPERTDATES